jgi:hypothetical protein
MKKHQLSFDSSLEETYHVLAIYTDETDYRLAYLLNQKLQIHLIKSFSILNHKNKTDFSVFEYEDKIFFNNWYLINNHCLVKNILENSQDLFNQTPISFSQKRYYIKKYKKAHYFLKIETENSKDIIDIIIKRIEEISLIYAVDLISKEKQITKKLQLF